MNDNTHSNSYLDLFVIWVGTILSHISASDFMVWITVVYTLLRTYVLVRDEFFRKKP